MRFFQKVSVVQATAVRPLYVAAVPLSESCKPRLGFLEVFELGVDLGVELSVEHTSTAKLLHWKPRRPAIFLLPAFLDVTFGTVPRLRMFAPWGPADKSNPSA
jgi:hypothetical protein